MIVKVFLLVLLSTVTSSFKETNIHLADTNTLDEYILCRHCGGDISAASYIVSISSPVSRFTYNDTLFEKEEVLIQTLSSGIISDLPIITLTHSDCVGIGEWEEGDSWFPGYKWKFCTCPDCGDFIGWLFEPINPAQESKKPFYGLILSSLIGESCKYFFIGCGYGSPTVGPVCYLFWVKLITGDILNV